MALCAALLGNGQRMVRCQSAHGAVPVILGAAVVVDGHLAIEIRSMAVLICAGWLAADIWR